MLTPPSTGGLWQTAAAIRTRGRDLPADEVRGTLTDIVLQVDRAADVVDQVRSFARDNSTAPRQSVCLVELVQTALSLTEARLRSTGAEVVVDVAEGLCCLGWPDRLAQVLVIVLTNAREALERRGRQRHNIGAPGPAGWQPRIAVSAGRGSEQTVTLAVSDNGDGIPQDVLARVFEPFFTTKPTGEGTGLGLAVARDLIDMHNGSITVESRPGLGSTFTLILPTADAQD